MLRSASSTSKQSSVDEDSPQLSLMTRMPLGLSAVRHLRRKRRKWASVRCPTHHCAQITSYDDDDGAQSFMGVARKRHFDAMAPTSIPSTVSFASTKAHAASLRVRAGSRTSTVEAPPGNSTCFVTLPMPAATCGNQNFIDAMI